MSRWRLRRATADDLERIMRLEESIFTSDAWSRSGMLNELTSTNGYYLVAHPVEEPDGIVGYAGLLAPSGSAQADVQTIAVAPDARRRGVGRALLSALMREAAARAAVEVFLEVRADNPGAQELYSSFGFEQIAVRPRYYQPDGVDALVLRVALGSNKAAR